MLILLSDGAPARIRTADLLITNQLLYQLSSKGIRDRVASRGLGDVYKRQMLVEKKILLRLNGKEKMFFYLDQKVLV